MPRISKIIFVGIIFLSLPVFVSADYIGQKVNFFIDPSYDTGNREQISATSREINSKIYFYIEDAWWDSLKYDQKNQIAVTLTSLGKEFEDKIYSTLASKFGSEWSPGIDKDNRITALFHQMKEGAGGYFNSGDEYPKVQNPSSNEREMIYLNANYITSPLIESYLAHEFIHLITFNQKDKIQGVVEEAWLNEARAEYVPTLFGYDDVYEGSYIQSRVRIFLEKPSDSLTEWKNEKPDYGVINLFTQYLVDHYGVEILVDSLKISKAGIPSLNEALFKNGFKEDFSRIFTDWTITVLVNDCSLGEKYCYFNPNLRNFKLTPQIHFLSLIGESTLSINQSSSNWAGNWYKIIGGKGTLTLEFDGDDMGNFKVPYLLCDYKGNCTINLLVLDKNQKGKIMISEFNTKYSSLTIIPSVQSQTQVFKPSYSFSWIASIVEKTPEEKEAELIQGLLAQVEFLQKEIARVQAQINAILAERGQLISCQHFETNLYYGQTNNTEVRCLQEFLKAQGQEIYPEGLITGNFLSLTSAAVIRFQEKYASEILIPLGLDQGTGFVGTKTRAKINQMLGI